MRRIIEINSAIQCMMPEEGPADIKKAIARLQKLLDRLRHIDGNHPRYLMAWNLSAHYGKIELQDMLFYYGYTKREVTSPVAKLNYEKAFARLKDLVDTAVAMLPYP